MNTRDPRDPRNPRDTRDTDYRGTRYSVTPEPRADRSWLRWAIPAALVALLLPLLFHRGHREPERMATVQHEGLMSNQYAAAPTMVYFESGGTQLTDAERQKLAEVASTARQSGSGVAVTGSRERVDAVRRALISAGLPESSIQVRESSAGSEAAPVQITLAEK